MTMLQFVLHLELGKLTDWLIACGTIGLVVVGAVSAYVAWRAFVLPRHEQEGQQILDYIEKLIAEGERRIQSSSDRMWKEHDDVPIENQELRSMRWNSMITTQAMATASYYTREVEPDVIRFLRINRKVSNFQKSQLRRLLLRVQENAHFKMIQVQEKPGDIMSLYKTPLSKSQEGLRQIACRQIEPMCESLVDIIKWLDKF